MAVQTSYTQTMAVALPGMIADMRDRTIESHAADVAINFGYIVVDGAVTGKSVMLPTAANQRVRGIALMDPSQEHTTVGGTTVQYAAKDAVNVMRQGMAYVVVKDAVNLDAAVFFYNSGADAGKCTMVDTGATDPVPEAVFRSTTTGAGIALVEINLPGAGTVGS